MIDYLCYCGRGGRETQGLLISINLRDGSEAFQAKHFCLFRCRQRAYISSPSEIPPEQNHIPTWSLSSSSLAMMLSCRAAKAARAQGAGLPPTMSVCAFFRVMFWNTMLIDQWSLITYQHLSQFRQHFQCACYFGWQATLYLNVYSLFRCTIW